MAMRVIEYLKDHHVPFETLAHPPAFTAARLAKYLHVSGRKVMKCVLVSAGCNVAVAALSATRRLNWASLVQLLGPQVRLATEEEVVGWFPDCEHGSLVPFGRLYGVTTILDADLNSEGLVFQAQRRSLAVRMRFRDYLRLEQPERWRLGVD